MVKPITTIVLIDIRHIIRTVLCLLLLSTGNEAASQVLYTPFPSSFRNTQTNELVNGTSLSPVFQKLRRNRPVKVMQIGDSHVRGNFLPRSLETTLKRYFPTVDFAYYGINGAWAKRFYEYDMVNRVSAEHPDLVVISFGTNEAHGSTIDERVHAETMDMLTRRISERCPGVCFLFTTPPGSYISQRTGSYTTGRGRYRRTRYNTTKVPNQNTTNVARSIVNYCRNRKYAVWDIYTIAGGSTSAFSNWKDAGMMNSDLVHYLASGYNLQGKLLGEAIYKAYQSTAQSGSQTRMNHGSTPQEQKPYVTVKGF